MTNQAQSSARPDAVILPTIAVVIPLYNGARYIEHALGSVLAQTLAPMEIIVVDDGSTDNSADIVERMAQAHPITLLHKPNGGQSSARNMGIRHANAELIALLDQDDVWYPTHLETLVEPFLEQRRTTIGWVYSNLDEIDVMGNLVGRSVLDGCSTPHPKDLLATCLREDMYILPSATLVSRQAVLAVGGFDEQLSGYEDDDLFIRLFHAGYDHAYVETPLGQWRIYKASSSYTPRMARSRMAFARKLLRQFPDEPFNQRFYSRDLIAPRFLRQAIAEARQALRERDPALIETCMADVAMLRGHASNRPDPETGRRALLITTIIPLYNGAAFIRESLTSVLNQTLPSDEIIVVDDGSVDDGPAIVAEMAQTHPIRLLRKDNGGQSSARNFGVAHAHGDLIALLDQDDAWYPDHLTKLVAPYHADDARQLAWTYSNLDEIDRDGHLILRSALDNARGSHPKQSLFVCLSQDMFILPSASLISREAFLAVGGFNEQLSGYEDDDLFLRLFRAGYDHAYIPTATTRWRIFPESASYSRRMAVSRMIYMRQLLALFPDDRLQGRYYTTRMIAPRFYRLVIGDYRRALLRNDTDRIPDLIRDLAEITRFMRLHMRLITYVFRPLLRTKFTGRFVLMGLYIGHAVFRRLLRVVR